MPLLVTAFLASLIVPLIINLGPLALQPYRIILLAAFFPLAARFFGGTVKLHAFDWLIAASVIWAALAYAANHGAAAVQPAGIRAVEVMGAWMLGRVGVRTAEDMQRVIRLLFWLAMALLPFAALEALTGRNLILSWIPSSPRILWPEPRMGMRRAQVVFSHAILYGVFVASAAGLVWYGYNQAASFASRVFRSVLLSIATVFSVSSGALLILVLQAIFIVYELMFKKMPGRWKLFGWTAALAYVVVDLLSNRTPFHLIVQYLAFSSVAGYNRILIFRYGMDTIWANPILGIGLNDWSRPWWMGDSVDNFWLLNAMQFGLPGFILFAGGFALLMRAAARSRLTDQTEWNLRAGWLTTMGGVIIAGGTVHYWTVMLSFVVFLFAAGGWFVRPEPETEEGAPPAGRRGAGKPTARARGAPGPATPPAAGRPSGASAASGRGAKPARAGTSTGPVPGGAAPDSPGASASPQSPAPRSEPRRPPKLARSESATGPDRPFSSSPRP